MKKVTVKNMMISLALLSASTSAQADLQLVCRNKSGMNVIIQSFTFTNATQRVEQATAVHFSQQSVGRSYDHDSFGNENESEVYQILQIQSSKNTYQMTLEAGGALGFNFDSLTQKWKGHFIFPRGPEMPMLLKNCDLLNPETSLRNIK